MILVNTAIAGRIFISENEQLARSAIGLQTGVDFYGNGSTMLKPSIVRVIKVQIKNTLFQLVF